MVCFKIVDKGFRVFWVLVTYLMAVLIPRLSVMIPLVGVTSGTLCALVYPPFFQMVTFWDDWKVPLLFIIIFLFYYPTHSAFQIELSPLKRFCWIGVNCLVILIGFFAIGAGVTANIIQILNPT